MSAICGFCGAQAGSPLYLDAARRLGEILAAHKHTLVYGGGSLGIALGRGSVGGRSRGNLGLSGGGISCGLSSRDLGNLKSKERAKG